MRGSAGAASIWVALGSLACTRWKCRASARLAWPLPQPTSQASSWCWHWPASHSSSAAGEVGRACAYCAAWPEKWSLKSLISVIEFAEAAGLQALQAMRADADADQAQRRQADRGGHAPHLPVAAFGDGQLDPAVGHRLAEAHRRIARPQPVGLADQRLHLGRASRPVLEGDAAAQRVQLFVRGFALHLHQVGLGPVEAGRADAGDQRAVVAEQQQTLGIEVEASGRINPRRQAESGQGRPRRFGAVGELAQHAIGLVEGKQHWPKCSPPRPFLLARLPATEGQALRGAYSAAVSAGFTKRRVMRSLSPMAAYFSRSASSWRLEGGSIQTPLGWSLVSAGLALISLCSSSTKPASVASWIT